MKIPIELLKRKWYERNPQHGINTNSREDMFWETVAMVFEDCYAELKKISADEKIYRKYLHSIHFGTSKAIEEEITSWKYLGQLAKKAAQVKERLKQKEV